MRSSVSILLLALLFVGCNRSDGPKPLTLEEIPGALRKAFQPAKMLVKQGAESIAKMIEEKQFAGATIQLQALMPQQLTDEQREVASAALQALNQKLQEQAAAFQPPPSEGGATPASQAPVKKEESAAAAAVMEHYIRTK